ncbi:putative cell wall-binding protein [Catenulispora sp. MAP5-51]|uniref:cell wall-binding repeat-containing protein n=1 Tax=Catenulispora sp. MAP5-51 TaxID=3156298 RepID=UPI003511E515
MVLPSSPPPPPPVIQPSVKRIGGSDRYQTSLLVSQAQWKDGSANAVVLARGDQAPDALAGVPLAAHVHGPLLLTDPSTLDRATSAEIARVTGGPAPDKTVYILGGNAAVSPSIESGLRAAGYHVVRYKGDDRYGTARAVASAFGSTSHVIVATGEDFPDALAAGPLGADRRRLCGQRRYAGADH